MDQDFFPRSCLFLSSSFTKFSPKFYKTQIFYSNKKKKKKPTIFSQNLQPYLFNSVFSRKPVNIRQTLFIKPKMHTLFRFFVSQPRTYKIVYNEVRRYFSTTRLGVTDTRRKATSHHSWLSLQYKLNIFIIHDYNICDKIWCLNF